MKILINNINRTTAPTGLCKYTVTLINLIQQAYPKVEISVVIGAWQAKYFSKMVQESNLKVDIFESGIKNNIYGRYIGAFLEFRNIMRSRRPSVVHFVTPSLSVLASSSKSVLTIHDLYAYTDPAALKPFNRILNRVVTAVSIGISSHLIAISNQTAFALNEYFPKARRKLSVIYQPVEILPLDGPPPSLGPYFLTVAGHRAHKNINLIIEALKRIKSEKKTKSEFSYIIVGADGTETEALKELAGVMPFPIHFISGISADKLGALYANCESVIIASANEGFCIPVVEAIHAGCRLVCSDISILREVADDYPTYFCLDAADPVGALADAIVSTGSRTKPGPTRTRYDFESSVGALKRVYDSVNTVE